MVTEKSIRIDNFRRIPGTKVFRSSKPDTPSSEIQLIKQNIKTLIDLTNDDFDNTHTSLDDIYPPFRLKIPFCGGGAKPTFMPVSESRLNREELEEDRRYRVSVPLASFRNLAATSPWYIRLLIILSSLSDCIFGTNLGIKVTVEFLLKPQGSGFVAWVLKTVTTENEVEIASILHLLCLPEYVPALVMCGVGKDRSGLVSALIGHICGHTKDELINEYTRSTKELPADKKELLRYDLVGLHPNSKLALPETMIEVFEYIDQRYGSVDRYLESIGFGQEDQEKLRKNILSK